MIPAESVFPTECDGKLCDHCVPYGCKNRLSGALARVLTLENLDSAYRDAMFGPESPDYMTIYCRECGKHFDFIKGVQGEPCEHLKKLFLVNSPVK